jgi:hypothetical protein
VARSWGMVKPPLGTPLRAGHPLAQGLVGLWAPHGWMPYTDHLGNLWTTGTGGSTEIGPYGLAAKRAGGTFVAQAANLQIPDVITVLVLALPDPPASSTSVFGNTSGNRCQVHLTDAGHVRWDWNSGVSPNRVAWTPPGAWFDSWHAMAFRAGALGSAIWSDGIKVASQGTALTRPSSVGFTVGAWSTLRHINPISSLWIFGRELTDSEIANWAADPWAMFSPPRRAWWQPGAGTADLAAGTAGTAGSTAALQITRALASTSAGRTTPTAALRVTRNLAGAAAGKTTPTATLGGTVALFAASAGQAASTAALRVTRALTGSAAGQASTTAALQVTRRLAALAAGASTATAGLLAAAQRLRVGVVLSRKTIATATTRAKTHSEGDTTR